MAVHDFGGDGPLLVLSHATGFCAGVWEPMAETLTTRFHTIGLDYRGHGQTVTPDTTTMVWSGMANDLLAVIDAYSPDAPVRVAGHSMGGGVIALTDRLRPGRISRAWGYEPILFDARERAVGDDPNHMAASARRRRREFDSRDEAYERYASRPPFDQLDPRGLRAYVDHGFADTDHGTVVLRCTPEREAETFENSGSNAFTAAGLIGFDYLVAVSGDGQPPAMMAETAASTHERLSLVRYPHLTHFGPLESPDELAADVIAWFDLLPDPGPN